MKNRSALHSERLPVVIIGTIIGGVIMAFSSVGIAKNLKAIKRLVEISKM
jgi:hypothetical protein